MQADSHLYRRFKDIRKQQLVHQERLISNYLDNSLMVVPELSQIRPRHHASCCHSANSRALHCSSLGLFLVCLFSLLL